MLNKVNEYINKAASLLKPVECVICGKSISGRYYVDAWKQAAHEHHKVSLCFACGRIIATNEPALPDGRQLCNHCQPSIVKTSQQIEWVNKKVRAALAKAGLDDVPQNVPVELVDLHRLKNLQGSKVIDANQRGLALFTKTIRNGMVSVEHSIYILDHLPKIAFAGVLAHELLHVWQNEKGISPPGNICEGFCNLGSYAIYHAINNQTSLIFIEQMEMSPDPIYGEGYRKVKGFLEKNGWAATITKMKEYKK